MRRLRTACLLLMLALTSCNNQDKVDPCANMVTGYVVGFNQCAAGFIVTTLSPADTMEVFNLPDSLFHFPADPLDDIYRNRGTDFLFPPAYTGNFPISYTYEIVPEAERNHVICTYQGIAHYTYAVKREIKIICVKKIG